MVMRQVYDSNVTNGNMSALAYPFPRAALVLIHEYLKDKRSAWEQREVNGRRI